MRTGSWSSAPADDSAGRAQPRPWWRYASYGALAVGAVLRITEYLTNRPLNIDESFIALNLLEKSPPDLLGRLDFRQASPVGFLEAEKLATVLFGKSEYALRLFPLLASLLSLLLFYHVAKRLVDSRAVPVACAVFALLDPLIFYGSTVKQYSLDVTAALTVYAIVTFARPVRMTRTEVIKLAGVGALLVWFSHAVVFVLAAIGITLVLRVARDARWDWLPGLGVAAAAWVVSLGIESYLTRENLATIRRGFGYASGTLLTSASDGSTWFDSATARARYLVGLEDTASGFPIFGSFPSAVNQGFTVLLVLVAVLGFLALVLRRPWSAILLGLPPVLALVAAALHTYPLVGRTLLFLLPAVALCIGEGIRVLLSARRSAVAVLGGLASVSLVTIAVLPAIHLVQPHASEGIRPALRDLGLHYRRGDSLYVRHFAQYGFVYYHLCGCAAFDPEKAWPFTTSGFPGGASPALIPRTPDLLLGGLTRSNGIPRSDGELLLGRARVWVLVSQTPERQLRPFLAYLNRHGRQLQRFAGYGVKGTAASLYLYDLS